ncbi:uncharacterized protein LOC121244204 [Juglans microcarpa x Juglans regia]|uniref:uncharacterized protein LOC121244204 n=1 Tax=Juglans microcarpa x Juglans regia TaxID=2249226 RepID=UPI001B7DD288|nr:uncharacterized protein LOC121244204 [Juglans microcarpa x Juglans regia]
MATDQDFSFPIIGDNFPCSIDSPPLWHLSPAASANSCHEEEEEANSCHEEEEEEEEEEDCFAPKPIQNSQRRSFSYVKGGGKLMNGEKEDDDEEEKMDMLWEDFNEELMCRITSCSSRSNAYASSSRDNNNMVELGCVKAMAATPKNPGTALSTRKPGMLVMMKVLKKLFLLQNSHRKLKRRGPHSHQ